MSAKTCLSKHSGHLGSSDLTETKILSSWYVLTLERQKLRPCQCRTEGLANCANSKLSWSQDDGLPHVLWYRSQARPLPHCKMVDISGLVTHQNSMKFHETHLVTQKNLMKWFSNLIFKMLHLSQIWFSTEAAAMLHETAYSIEWVHELGGCFWWGGCKIRSTPFGVNESQWTSANAFKDAKDPILHCFPRSTYDSWCLYPTIYNGYINENSREGMTWFECSELGNLCMSHHAPLRSSGRRAPTRFISF